MYIIKHKFCDILVDGRRRSGYFVGIEEHGLPDYDSRDKAMTFTTREEAKAVLRSIIGKHRNVDMFDIVRK